jgi:hypothetical protein
MDADPTRANPSSAAQKTAQNTIFMEQLPKRKTHPAFFEIHIRIHSSYYNPSRYYGKANLSGRAEFKA